ncbi:hypothetical protein LQZ19_18295 [Treponema primitia]|uniref:leucine-rich repeat domain-containing protein n=1 Tax=Treponema primitia TaxID=88058 RepID=UPI00397F6D3F
MSALTFLESLVFDYIKITELPDWFSKFTNLKKLTLSLDGNPVIFPDVICRMPSLVSLNLSGTNITGIPENIVNLSLLEELDLSNGKLLSLPDNFGSLGALKKINISGNELISLPDSVGNLLELQEFNLSRNPLPYLPECIGKLEKLENLDLSNTKINGLPKSIGNLAQLTSLDIRGLNIEDAYIPKSLLDRPGVYSPDKENHGLHIIRYKYAYPEGALNYDTFIALYYLTFQDILCFSEKAEREGLLSLEDEIEYIGNAIFRKGLRLVVEGTDNSIIRHVLLTSIERETNQYQKKLKMLALEGILAIQAGESTSSMMLRLNSMIAIKDNLFDKACAAYLNGDEESYEKAMEAISKIKIPEEREEVNFILRAIKFNEIIRRSGFKAIEKMLNTQALASRDIFEYGLRLYLDCEQEEYINQILDNFISQETDPDRKNLCLAKRKALDCIIAGDNTRILTMSLIAYFDEYVEQRVLKSGYANYHEPIYN